MRAPSLLSGFHTLASKGFAWLIRVLKRVSINSYHRNFLNLSVLLLSFIIII